MSAQENRSRLDGIHSGTGSLIQAIRETQAFLKPGDSKAGGSEVYVHFDEASREVKIRTDAASSPVIFSQEIVDFGEADEMKFAGDPAQMSFQNGETHFNPSNFASSVLFPTPTFVAALPFTREMSLLKNIDTIQEMIGLSTGL